MRIDSGHSGMLDGKAIRANEAEPKKEFRGAGTGIG